MRVRQLVRVRCWGGVGVLRGKGETRDFCLPEHRGGSCGCTARWWPPTSQEKRPQIATYLARTLTLDF